MFLASQAKYTEDPDSNEELKKAIKTGKVSQETLNEQPDLAKSMGLQISAIQPLERKATLNALQGKQEGYIK